MRTLETTTRTVQASEAKTHFLRILDEVEQGQSILVTRHGRTVARITPEKKPIDPEKVRAAAANIEALRKQVGKLSIEEILSARDEGRR